jgi:hypothetical protein
MAEAGQVYVYPEPDELKFAEGNSSRNLIEQTAELNTEARDYLKIQVISSENNSYSNYVNRTNNNTGAPLNSTLNGTNNTIISSGDTIYLYMPQQLSESFQQGYNTESIGMLGAGILNMMGSRGDIGSMASELQGASQGMKPEVAIKAMAGAISGLGNLLGTGSNLSGQGVSQLTRGAVLNPYKELIYQGTEFRTHTFSFKLIARTFKDAIKINAIISSLRYAMHPGVAGVGADEQLDGTLSKKFTGPGKDSVSSDRWLILPDFFKLELVRVGGSSVNQSQPLNKLIQFPTFCVLEGMSVNYTPDGTYAPIKDLSETYKTNEYGVVAVQIDLQFKETAMLTKANFSKTGKRDSLVSQDVAAKLAQLNK